MSPADRQRTDMKGSLTAIPDHQGFRVDPVQRGHKPHLIRVTTDHLQVIDGPEVPIALVDKLNLCLFRPCHRTQIDLLGVGCRVTVVGGHSEHVGGCDKFVIAHRNPGSASHCVLVLVAEGKGEAAAGACVEPRGKEFFVGCRQTGRIDNGPRRRKGRSDRSATAGQTRRSFCPCPCHRPIRRNAVREVFAKKDGRDLDTGRSPKATQGYGKGTFVRVI